jgi:hypothetical protein
MRISFVADYRSPIARQWIDWMSARHSVQVVSSYPLSYDYSRSGIRVEYEALGPAAVTQGLAMDLRLVQGRLSIPGAGAAVQRRKSRASTANPRLSTIASILGPFEVVTHIRRLKRKIESFRPDLVHAMRIPYEAMAATRCGVDRPLVTSIWGNDLTLHAESSRMMGARTRSTLHSTDALHTDCERDLRLAGSWGWSALKPSLVVPGSGGVDSRLFSPGRSLLRSRLGIPANAPVILNPRGIRGYSYTIEFLRAMETLLAERPYIHVVCTGMQGHRPIQDRVARMSMRDRVHLLPDMRHSEMPDVYRLSDVVVSLTSHDGTPNSLLEAMASGCLPVVGRVESLLEWIDHGSNGLVVDPTDVSAVVRTIQRAVSDDHLRERAARTNASLVHRRADLETCMQKASAFYEALASQPRFVERSARRSRKSL